MHCASITLMPALHVRDIPEDVYEALRRRAKEQGRSISSETIAILKSAVADRLIARAELRRRIEARRAEFGTIDFDSEATVREDRDR